MFARRTALAALAACLGLLLLASSAFAATLKADYHFQNSLASSCCSAPDLADVGAGLDYATESVGGVSRIVRTFPANNGEQYQSNLNDDGDYSIAVLFRFADVTGFRKLIDFRAPLGGHAGSTTTD